MPASDVASEEGLVSVRVLLVGAPAEDAAWLRELLAASVSHSFEVTDDSRDVASPPDVLLLALGRAPDPAAVGELASRMPGVPILVIGDAEDETGALRLLRAGASAYLARREVVSRLLVTSVVAAVEQHRAITELRGADQRARHLTTHDALTDLANREFFESSVEQAIALARRGKRELAVLVVDVDGLKAINETFGHDAGDQLLREVANRLLETVRSSDSVACLPDEDGSISRLGGGEFMILLSEIAEPRDAALVARRVLEIFARPFQVAGRETFMSACTGIAVYPFDGQNAQTLMRNAQSALHQAKAEGRNGFRFVEPLMNAQAVRKLELANRLHRALERRELAVYYQPVREAASGRLIGAEALLRWNCPENGAVPPVEFIPIAEATGLIVPIGEWVLRTACAQVEAWRSAGLAPIRMAVNLSLHQLKDGSLVHTVKRVLRETGLSPAQVELEITESALAQDDGSTAAAMRELHDLGVGFSLDDFGTGYSGLSHLKRLPIERLKIDRSLIGAITTNPDDAALTSAVIAMAHALDLGVVAECVETEEQARALRQRGCDELQGFLFSPAVPPDTFLRFLQREKQLPPRRSR